MSSISKLLFFTLLAYLSRVCCHSVDNSREYSDTISVYCASVGYIHRLSSFVKNFSISFLINFSAPLNFIYALSILFNISFNPATNCVSFVSSTTGSSSAFGAVGGVFGWLLEFPALSVPNHFASEININKQHVVIVDDSSDIINFWQEYFLFNAKHINTKYFLTFSALDSYLLQAPNEDRTFLLDYSILGEKLTAIDVITKFKLTNVYLITNYAEDIKLQDEIKSLAIKLVPKTMLHIMQNNKAIYNCQS